MHRPCYFVHYLLFCEYTYFKRLFYLSILILSQLASKARMGQTVKRSVTVTKTPSVTQGQARVSVPRVARAVNAIKVSGHYDVRLIGPL